VFDHLTVEDGLSQSTVTSVAQDAEGFVWLGTDDGVNRYDGHTFTVFRHAAADSTSLPHSSVEDVLVDARGRVWVATFGGGLARFEPDTQTFRSFVPDTAGAAQRVIVLHEGPDGAIWFGTDGAGLFRFDVETETFRSYAALGDPFVRAFANSAVGGLWLGTSRGLVHLDLRTGTETTRQLAPDSVVTAVAVDRGGEVWAGTSAGLARLNPVTGTVTMYPFDTADPAKLPAGGVSGILPRSDGTLWVGSDRGGLRVLDPASGAASPVGQRPEFARGLIPGRLRTLFEDESGLLWVGTWGNGVAKQRAAPFGALVHQPDAPPSASPPADVGAFGEDAEGRLWLGSFTSGIARYDPATGRFERFTQANSGLPTDAQRAVTVDAAGRVWVGSGGRFDPETRRYELVPRLLPDGRRQPIGGIVSFHRDGTGGLWVASYGTGPCRYDPEPDAFRCLLDERPDLALSNRSTYAVHLDRAGRLWASPWGGGVDVIDLATGAVTAYRHDDAEPGSLSHNSVVHIDETRDGTLWVSTYGGGLNRFDAATGRFTALTTADGLPSNVVYGFLEDAAGRLWMSTNRGIARVDPASDEVVAFSASDGLQGDEYNGHSLLRLRSGAMAFGGVQGFDLFDPATVRQRTYAPPIALTDVQVMGSTYPFREAMRAGTPLRLEHGQNFLSFQFAALDFDAPAATRYAYRLEGLDARWVDSGTRRYATYSHLRPGRYVLHVRGTNSDGVWSPHEARFAFDIVPPFWQTLWFRLTTGLGLLAGLVAVVRFVATRRLRERMRTLEAERRVQTERERISRDLHDHVGAQLATMISGIELVHLAARADEPDRAREHLDMLEDDARRTMAQLRETIWALDQEAVSVDEFVGRVRQFTEQQTRYRAQPAATCSAEGAEGVQLSPIQALHLFRITQEAVTNALKHADATVLHVDLRRLDGGRLRLSVADDGCTAPPVTTGDGAVGDAAAEDALTGYGLRNMRHRAEDLGGTFEMRPTEPTGTEIRVTVPLDAAASA
jgi:signal transduction histidine kinase/ligand-binding sensor domain-containing protein